MDLWRLERLRLLRTRRLGVLLGVYAFFGVLGPVTARYLAELLVRLGGPAPDQLVLPDPTPAQAMVQFTSNASQIGVLTVVVVAAGACNVDALEEMGVFLRTRVHSVRELLTPRVATTAGAATLALVVGTVVTVVVTRALLGPLDLGAVVLGTAYGALYLAFAVALTAAFAVRGGSTTSTVLWTLVTLIALPLLAVVPQLERWVPSERVGAVDALVAGGDPWRVAPAAGVAMLAIAGLLALATRTLRRREV
jgi:ABC-2 type transport system permease protein